MHDVNRPKRIHISGEADGIYEEGYSGATITPGMLVKLNSLSKIVPHSTSGGPAEHAFAIEDALQGRTMGDNYANGELVRYVCGESGSKIYGILADGENIVAGDYLASNGDGYLKKVSGTNVALAVALEAIDASGSSDTLETRRIRTRII